MAWPQASWQNRLRSSQAAACTCTSASRMTKVATCSQARARTSLSPTRFATLSVALPQRCANRWVDRSGRAGCGTDLRAVRSSWPCPRHGLDQDGVRRACRKLPRPLAAATTTAASAAARSRCLRAAGDSAEAEQPNGVVVALWAGRRLGGCAHRARLHERRPAGAAPELVLGHDVSVASPVGVVRCVRATDNSEATAQDDVRAIGSGRQPPRRWGADPGRRYGPSPPVE